MEHFCCRRCGGHSRLLFTVCRLKMGCTRKASWHGHVDAVSTHADAFAEGLIPRVLAIFYSSQAPHTNPESLCELSRCTAFPEVTTFTGSDRHKESEVYIRRNAFDGENYLRNLCFILLGSYICRGGQNSCKELRSRKVSLPRDILAVEFKTPVAC